MPPPTLPYPTFLAARCPQTCKVSLTGYPTQCGPVFQAIALMLITGAGACRAARLAGSARRTQCCVLLCDVCARSARHTTWHLAPVAAHVRAPLSAPRPVYWRPYGPAGSPAALPAARGPA